MGSSMSVAYGQQYNIEEKPFTSKLRHNDEVLLLAAALTGSMWSSVGLVEVGLRKKKAYH